MKIYIIKGIKKAATKIIIIEKLAAFGIQYKSRLDQSYIIFDK